MSRAVIALLAAVLFLAFAAAASAGNIIYVRNDPASTIPQEDVDAAIPAFQLAISRDFAPVWGVDAVLTTDPAAAPTATMQVNLLDLSPVAGALGFHEVFAGKPVAYVFEKDAADANQAWPLIFMHEVFEMLADPWADRVSQDPIDGKFWAVEVCDPVQSGYFAYYIDGIPISDFVTPAWYHVKRGRFDFMHKLTKPHSVGRHSYAQWFDFQLLRWHTVLG